MAYQLKGGQIAHKDMTCKECGFYRDCLFDAKQRGGFKDHGPKYIGYRLITDRVENNGAKEDSGTCFNFIENGLQKRLSVGRGLREDGKDGDLVKIIAQEGEYITRDVMVGMNLKGEIVKPQPHLIETFKKAGYKVSTDPGTVAVTWPIIEYKEMVPFWADEQRRVTGPSQKIMERELMEQSATEDAEDKLWEEAQARKRAAMAESAEPEADLELGGKAARKAS